LSLPLTYHELDPEPGPVTISDPLEGNGSFEFESDYDHHHGSHLIDQSSIGSELGPGIAFGIEGDQSLYESNIDIDNKEIPTFSTATEYDQLPINTPFHHFRPAYSPVQQFTHAEYILPLAPHFNTTVDQINPTSYLIDPSTNTTITNTSDNPSPGIQIDQLVTSPSGHWTPVTPTSQLPSQELGYLYEPFPLPQPRTLPQLVQIPEHLQDYTPTLAPHYPDLDLDLDLDFEFDNEMTREFPSQHSYADRNNHNTHQGYHQ